MMTIRRAGMERFGETAIQKDMPMAMIEEVLVPLYLHHRYAVESAASAIGGQNYIYAMRGDGRKPVRMGAGRRAEGGARRADGDAEAVGAGAVARRAVEDSAAPARVRAHARAVPALTRAARSIRSCRRRWPPT